MKKSKLSLSNSKEMQLAKIDEMNEANYKLKNLN